MTVLRAEPLTAQSFAPFGDVLAAEGAPDRLINQGLCGRFHDRARLDLVGGRLGISLFLAEPRALPYRLEMVERHRLGPQAFLPMTEHPFLVIVAEGSGPEPGPIHAFVTDGAQGINLRRGTWHGVCTPLHAPGRFAVVDRIASAGEAPDVTEFWLDEPVTVYANLG